MKCPGQDTQYWKPGAIYEVKCPECGHIVEFFKDDTARKCGKCGHRFANPEMDFGCAAYCQFAEQCLGTIPEEALAQRDDLLKDRIAIEMKRYFKTDFKRIAHAMRVARYAERIGKFEAANMPVVLAAAYLKNIGSVEAERKHDSTDPRFRAEEGVPIAREMMIKLGAAEKLIDEVSAIVGQYEAPDKEDDLVLQVIFDADRIATLEDHQKEAPLEEFALKEMIETTFLTASGKQLALKTLLNQ
jgi:hypothetical protein